MFKVVSLVSYELIQLFQSRFALLLTSQMHESGFGVQEEGVPPAQRVLISDVPAQAVFALLQYLYTAHFSLPASLQPHVLELARRY